MERGSAKNGPRQDDALAEELDGNLGPGGSNREEWTDPEPPAGDDPSARVDLPAGPTATTYGVDPDGRDQPMESPDEAEMHLLQHEMGVAQDWNPASEAT